MCLQFFSLEGFDCPQNISIFTFSGNMVTLTKVVYLGIEEDFGKGKPPEPKCHAVTQIDETHEIIHHASFPPKPL